MQALFWSALLVLCAVNAVAFMHARAMLTFTGSESKTKNPEQLSAASKLFVLLTGIRNPRPIDGARPESAQALRIPAANGLTLGAWLMPHPAPAGSVILFHGYTASKSQLLDEARLFHARGFHVLLVDFRGSGDSSASHTTIGYEEAEDVRATIDYARATLGFDRPLVYARSMGAAAVLRAAALYELPVRALIIEGVFDTMLNTVKQRFYSMGIPATPFAHLLVLWGGLQHGFWAFDHNPVRYARACKLPVLMLHGEDDARATLAQARTVFDALRGPKLFHAFPTAGHEALAVLDRARWNTALDELLSTAR